MAGCTEGSAALRRLDSTPRFRVMRTILSAAAVVLGLVGSVWIAAATAGEPREPIPRLIEQLGSAKYVEREAASQALEAVGERALPALKDATHGTDVEVCRRAEELVQRIEKRLEAARLLEPKRVRLACRDQLVPDAVAELRRQ